MKGHLYFDYGFPRIMLPDPASRRTFLITWQELKPFISRRGLLGKFSLANILGSL